MKGDEDMIWDEMWYNQQEPSFSQKLETEPERIEVNIAEEYIGKDN